MKSVKKLCKWVMFMVGTLNIILFTIFFAMTIENTTELFIYLLVIYVTTPLFLYIAYKVPISLLEWYIKKNGRENTND